MYFRLGCLAIVPSILWLAAAPVHGDETKDDAKDISSSFSARILAVTDTILNKHIDPPARQAMILAGTKALYQANNRRIPKGLSRRVSELATTEQLTDYLDGVRGEFKSMPNMEMILTQGMFAGIPGGATLINTEGDKVNEQLRKNRYVGTGIALGMSQPDQTPQILKVFYDGPAWKAGIKAKDLILEIEGQSTTKKNLRQIVEELRGEAGEDVGVVVRQPDSEESRKLTITRGRVFIPSVEGVRELPEGKWQFSIDSASEIALIRFKSFGPSTLHELRKAAEQLRDKDIRGVILDLRLGGGLLHDTILVADSLLDGGVIGHIQSLDAERKHEAQPGELFPNLPIAVLVAKQTSSGNVFLAAALQDNQRAVVVGEPTAGNTYVRSFVDIPGRNDKIVMATAIMLRGDKTPLVVRRSGSPQRVTPPPIHGINSKKRPGFIMPDHVVANDNIEGRRQKKDAILAKAIEVLTSSTEEDGVSAKKKRRTTVER